MNFIFSRILIAWKILRKNIFFLRDYGYEIKVNRAFSASVFTGLSIPMEKKWKSKIWFILEIWLVESFWRWKNFFHTDLDSTTMVNRIYSASSFTGLTIPMEKKWKNWISIFLEFWLVEKMWEKRKFFSRIWWIQQRLKEFFQHQCSLISRFQWGKNRIIAFDFFSNSHWSNNVEKRNFFSLISRIQQKPIVFFQHQCSLVSWFQREKKPNNSAWVFLEFWLVEKFLCKKLRLSQIWRIELKSSR